MKTLSVPFISAEGILFAARCAETDIQAVEEQIRELQKKRERMGAYIATVDRLRQSWKDEDPGKYGEHCFLVGRAWLESTTCQALSEVSTVDYFWVPEMVDDPEAAHQGRHGRWRRDKLIPVPFGTLDEAARRKCPHCRRDGLVIGSYEQTYDGPDGDSWEMNLSVLCPGCLEKTAFAGYTSSYRCLGTSARLAKKSG